MGRVVLVTGAARDLGSRVLRLLHDDPDVDLAVGVDVVPPRRDVGGALFVRGDIRTPVVGRLIAEHGVDTVAHLGVLATPRAPSATAASKEVNVIGTLQVLAACQAAPSVRRLVVRSTTAVYGAGPRDPALFDEDDVTHRDLRRARCLLLVATLDARLLQQLAVLLLGHALTALLDHRAHEGTSFSKSG